MRRLLASLTALSAGLILIASWLSRAKDVIEAPGNAVSIARRITAMVDGVPFFQVALISVMIVALIIATLEWWWHIVGSLFNNQRQGMPLIDLRTMAMGQGWKLGSATEDNADFVEALAQSGVDAVLLFRGRQNKYPTYPDLNLSERIVDVPKEHWKSHRIDWLTFANAKSNIDMKSEPSPGSEDWDACFVDLHIDAKSARLWLRRDAEQFRGNFARRHAKA